MLQRVILRPNIDDDVVEEMKRVIEFQWMDIVSEILLSEGLSLAGYGTLNSNVNSNANSNESESETIRGAQEQFQLQQLGKPQFCKSKEKNKNCKSTKIATLKVFNMKSSKCVSFLCSELNTKYSSFFVCHNTFVS